MKRCVRSVKMESGARQLTRTPYAPTSLATCRESIITPALAAAGGKRGQHLDRPELLLYPLSHTLDGREVGHVGSDSDRMTPVEAYLIYHGGDLGLIPAMHHHPRAACGQQPAGGRPDTARPAGDHGDLADEVRVGGDVFGHD